MSFREQILHGFAGFHIPFRHIRFFHGFPHIRFQPFFRRLSLAHIFHDLKGHGRIHSPGDERGHHVITGGDRLFHRMTGRDKILGIADPNIGTMGITGYPDNIAEQFRF